MEKVHPKLFQEYERTRKKINGKDISGSDIITIDDVLKAHFLITDYFIEEGEQIICGVKNLTLLGSTVGRQKAGFAGVDKYKTPIEKCATLFFGLVKNHAFHDGNKRTALLALIYHLNIIGRTIKSKQKVFEKLAVDIAANNLDNYPRYKTFKAKGFDAEVNFIVDFLRRNSRKTDKRYYQVTYKEFENLLNKHGVYLQKATGNYIDVIKHQKKKRLFREEKIETVKIMQIGFPGWKKKIGLRAAKEVLKKTGLTTENGIDSKVFYQGHSPLGALIDEFRGPLRRLKDK